MSVALDGRALVPGEYELGEDSLAIAAVPQHFTLETVSRIRPQQNKALEGLYASTNGYFTQCEAQGFRRITWFLDRPDVMARYTVTSTPSAQRCPQLLSNGNLVAQRRRGGGRHWARWQDPFPKPCYLFAVVAAKLDVLSDSYRHPLRPRGASWRSTSSPASSTSADTPCAR